MIRKSVTLLAGVAAMATVLLPGTASAATGAITGFGGKCVDIAGANSANGTAVQLYDCNGSAAQQWTTGSDGSIQALGKCLDVAGANPANGTKVQIWDCNGSAAQQWTIGANGAIQALGKCLDATNNSSANGTLLQIWDCAGSANQTWAAPGGGTTPPPPPPPPPPNGAMAVAPYYYNGWGSPPDPRTIMNATGVKWFTMAFVLNNGYCNPMWDGGRPLTGGVDQNTINTIRAAGGDVVPSFGGANGNKLEASCNSAGELAAAYQKVINTYGLKGIDLDFEGDVYGNATYQQRMVDALKIIRANNAGIAIYVTIGSGKTGPGNDLITRAANSGLTVDVWTIMPFDFGGAGQDMAMLTAQATDGLERAVRDAYHYSDDVAYRHSGLSSMNGITDNNERVTVANAQTMLGYANQHHLGRFTFWSANRDRPCPGAYPNDDTCSGVAQNAWDFTRTFAQYKG
jgi:hypothetical protein